MLSKVCNVHTRQQYNVHSSLVSWLFEFIVVPLHYCHSPHGRTVHTVGSIVTWVECAMDLIGTCGARTINICLQCCEHCLLIKIFAKFNNSTFELCACERNRNGPLRTIHFIKQTICYIRICQSEIFIICSVGDSKRERARQRRRGESERERGREMSSAHTMWRQSGKPHAMQLFTHSVH